MPASDVLPDQDALPAGHCMPTSDVLPDQAASPPASDGMPADPDALPTACDAVSAGSDALPAAPDGRLADPHLPDRVHPDAMRCASGHAVSAACDSVFAGRDLSDAASHPDAMRRASYNELPARDGVPSGDVGLRGCSSAGSGARGGRSGLPIPVPVPADDLPAASDAVPAHPGCLSAAAPGDAVPAHPLPAPDTLPADSRG